MAYAKVYFENPHTGQMKEAPVGFSWTVLFFGFFPALFRGHWGGFAILLLVGLITSGLSNLVFMFIYNKMYIKYLVSEGYMVRSSTADLSFVEQKMNFRFPQLAKT